ncbi:MAG: nucleotidyltransferase family protein [Candidatus Bathyarchaeia archaeon]|jgi:NDP-sugar pyrophosphorylase family protein
MKIDTAVVLAGGQGDRLKPLTNDVPKAMVEIKNKPLLQWIVEWLRNYNVKEIVLGVAYLKEKIMDYFGDGARFGVNIRYSVHTVEGGTAEGFRLAISRYVDRDVFFALNGDQITSIDLNDLASFHLKGNSIATMAVANLCCPYGHVEINDKHNVVGFVEKPVCLHMSCNTGIYVFSREILKYLPDTGDIEKTTFLSLAKSNLLKAYPYNGIFVTVNTHKDLVEVKKQFGDAE